MLTRDLFAVAMPFLLTMFIDEQVVNIAILVYFNYYAPAP